MKWAHDNQKDNDSLLFFLQTWQIKKKKKTEMCKVMNIWMRNEIVCHVVGRERERGQLRWIVEVWNEVRETDSCSFTYGQRRLYTIIQGLYL